MRSMIKPFLVGFICGVGFGYLLCLIHILVQKGM